MEGIWRDLPVILAAPAQTAFVLLYTIRRLGAGQWWRDPVGRALGLKSITLAMLIDVGAVGYAFDLDCLVIACYWLVAAAIWYQLSALAWLRFHPLPRSTAPRQHI